MTYDEFYGHVVVVFSTAMQWRGEKGIWWPHGTPEEYRVEWRTGGMCGGNCWGDSADHPVEPEEERNLDLLDKLMDEVCPDITMRKYKQVLAMCVKTDSSSNYEYYGNFTTYRSKKVRFQDLYDALREQGVL